MDDEGANIVVVKDHNLLIMKRRSGNHVMQSAGAKARLEYIGTLPVFLGDKWYFIPGVYASSSSRNNLLSTGHLLRFAGFRDATHSMYKYLKLAPPSGKTIHIPCSQDMTIVPRMHQINALDFITFKVFSKEFINLHSDELNYKSDKSVSPQVCVATRSSTKERRLADSSSSSESSDQTPASLLVDRASDWDSSSLPKHKGNVQQGMESMIRSLKERLHSSLIQLFPSLEEDITVENIIGDLQSDYPSLYRRFIVGWNQSQDVKFSQYLDCLIKLQSQYDKFVSNGKFFEDARRTLKNNEDDPQDSSTSTKHTQKSSTEPPSWSDCPNPEHHSDPPEKDSDILIRESKFTPRFLHLALGHFGKDSINRTMQNGCFSHIPENWSKILDFVCCICKIVKENRPAKSVSYSFGSYSPGQYLFIDFAFVETPSIRGFTSLLGVVCASTGYEFNFCTRHKRAPVSLIRYLLRHFRNIKRPCGYIRTDQGGELAGSTEFNKMCLEEGVVIHDNGGYFPASLATVETRWGPRKSSVRAMLKHAPPEITDEYWCFANDYYTMINRRICRKGKTKSPFQLWNDDRLPSFVDIHPFGCVCYTPEQKTNKLKALQDKYALGYFLGFGASTHVVNYKIPGKRKLGRCNKPLFDTLGLGLDIADPFHPLRSIIDSQELPENLPESEFSFTSQAFPASDIFRYKVTIPRHGPYRLSLKDDEVFGLPLIENVYSDSAFYRNLPGKYRRNTFILQIHEDEPITGERIVEYLNFLRTQKIFTFEVSLCKRPVPDATEYQQLRQFCNQFRPVIATAMLQTNVNIRVSEQIPIPTPATLRTNPYGPYWKMASFNRYDKNMEIPTWGTPVSRSLIPKDAKVYQPVTVYQARDTAEENVKELYVRVCVNGSKQEPHIDYVPELAPTVGHSSLRFCIAIAAFKGLKACFGDFSNAFQHTPRPLKADPVYITPPPYFIEWFRQKYPNVKLKGEKPYVIEVLTFLNGFRDAGSEFYKMMKEYFKKAGLKASQIDPSVFFLKRTVDGEEQFCLIFTLVDDIGIFYSHDIIITNIKKILGNGLKISYQKGPVYKFGNFRIIESEYGYSIDQTAHILKTTCEFFDKDSPVAKVYTPLRTDKEFEAQMSIAVPATPEQLKDLAENFGGSYLTIFGKLLNIMSGSRPDLANAINRLGVFQTAPTELGFWALRRILQYLRCLPNIPLFYPRGSGKETSVFHSQVFLNNGEEDKLIIPHCLCGHADISFAPHRFKRHSVQANIETFLGVIIAWKVIAQTVCASSTCESELRANYTENQRIKACRNFLYEIGIPDALINHLFPDSMATPIFSDNKGTRDFVKGEKMTKNLKHIEIPICIIQDNELCDITRCMPCSTNTILADPFTKSVSGKDLKTKRNFYMGVRFYPPTGSQHYYYMTHPYHDDDDRKDLEVPLNI